MKKITSQKLTKRLSRYGTLAVAISGIAEANGQINFTDNVDETIANTSYGLDLDNDGVIDFVIEQESDSSSSSSYSRSIAVRADNVNNAILGGTYVYSSTATYFLPYALASDVNISSGNTSFNSGLGNSFSSAVSHLMNFSYSSSGSGWNAASPSLINWPAGTTDKFLGLRFEISGNTHYGWAKLSVDANGIPTLLSYAYNETPGEAIKTAQTSLSVEDNELASSVRIVTLNKSISLYNLPESVSYKLYAITGQEVTTGTVSNREMHIIEANDISTGIYVLKIRDDKTGAILTKKVML